MLLATLPFFRLPYALILLEYHHQRRLVIFSCHFVLLWILSLPLFLYSRDRDFGFVVQVLHSSDGTRKSCLFCWTFCPDLTGHDRPRARDCGYVALSSFQKKILLTPSLF